MKGKAPHRFIADAMVGRLAKWLRILGHDVLTYQRETNKTKTSADQIIEIARFENRLLLTRDKCLIKRNNLPPCLFIRHDRLDDQLRQVIGELNLKPEASPNRCLDCNSPLEKIGKETVKERVPSYVYQTQTTFHVCPRCRKIFWSGTHVERMMERLKQVEPLG